MMTWIKIAISIVPILMRALMRSEEEGGGSAVKRASAVDLILTELEAAGVSRPKLIEADVVEQAGRVVDEIVRLINLLKE